MYLVYTSESGDTGGSLRDPNQPHHVYGGLMVHESQWDGIKADFSGLRRRYLEAPNAPRELNASQILHGKGPFTSWHRSRRLQLIDDLLKILIQRETPLLVCYVNKDDFVSAQGGAARSEGRWRSPWEPAFSRFVYYLDLFMDELNLTAMSQEELIRGAPIRISERAVIIAGRSDGADPGVMQRLLNTEIDLPTGAVHENMYLVRSEDSHCTQLADICTYFFRRHLQRPSQPNPQYDSLEEGHVIQVIHQVQF